MATITLPVTSGADTGSVHSAARLRLRYQSPVLLFVGRHKPIC
jgi:hypothetical protein